MIRLLAVAAVLCAASASRADVCGGSCAPGDLTCTAAVTLCEAKLRAFDLYMRQMDAGQPKHALPPVYRDIVRAHYPSEVVDQVRFAFSEQQPPDNATTDCRFLYFNDASYVAALRDAGPNLKWTWLLHELAHAEQCFRGGGRDEYALRWWDELEVAVRESGESIDVFQTTEELVRQLQALYLRVHAAMPMEQAADARAEAVLAELRRCCIAPDGSPVRPQTPGP